MMIAQYGLGFSAGLLSLLAPCVLPLIPIIFGSSMQSSKFGPIANALGLTFSFTLIGVLSSLFSSVFDIDTIQKVGAIILIFVGVIFLVPSLKDKITIRLNFVGSMGSNLQGKIKGSGLISEFLMGSVLGMIWGPCSGPTLAFAFGIATQTDQLFHATMIFFFFGLGAGVGLISLGLLLRRFSKLTGKLMKHIKLMNGLTGIASISIGAIILFEKLGGIEEMIIQYFPDWLIQLSVSL
jgi:cytochrome c-type biogenesis protein